MPIFKIIVTHILIVSDGVKYPASAGKTWSDKRHIATSKVVTVKDGFVEKYTRITKIPTMVNFLDSKEFVRIILSSTNIRLLKMY